MKAFVLLGTLGLTTFCYGQTSNKAQMSPGAQTAKAAPAPKPCGMTVEGRAAIANIVLHPDDFSLDDPVVSNIFDNFKSYFKLSDTCRHKVGDATAQLSGADDTALLDTFKLLGVMNEGDSQRKKYTEQLVEQSNALSDLTQRYNALLIKYNSLEATYEGVSAGYNMALSFFKGPSPMHMTCVPISGCGGELFPPKPLTPILFHMTCYASNGQTVCDGDLMP